MKEIRLQALFVATLLSAGSQFALAGNTKVKVGGINYSLNDESMTATVAQTADASGNILLPETVSYGDKNYVLKSIGDEAFVKCKNITSIDIPSSVTSIGKHAFFGCINLTSLKIPSGVTSIEEGLFELCKGLASVDLPTSLTSIGHHAFYGCSSLTSVDIPSSVTSIAGRAFIGSGLTSVAIPSGVTSIEDEVFYSCESLTSVSLPSGVTSIGQGAFGDCYSLTSVNIPSSVEEIGDKAFYFCTSLPSIDMPSSVTTIGEDAFYRCSSLTAVTIPSSVTSIGESAFENCDNLENIVVEDGNTVYDSRNNCNAIIQTSSNKLLMACKGSTIPYGVTIIGANAFDGIKGLTAITIPSSVTSIEDNAFRFCYNLTSITIPSSVSFIGEKNPFEGCSKLTSIVVEDGNNAYDSRNDCNAIIETATGRLVSGCGNTIIPDGVTAIGDEAFVSCKGLSSIEFPSSVTSIGKYAFWSSSVTSIDIPSSVTSIGKDAFDFCWNLTSVTLRSSATAIGDDAFSNCLYLKDVYCHGTEMIEKYSETCFRSIAEDATLHVKASLVDKYKATSPWDSWFANIVAIDGEASVGNIDADAQDTYQIFSVDGRRLPSMQKGINILRSKNGKNVKVMK